MFVCGRYSANSREQQGTARNARHEAWKMKFKAKYVVCLWWERNCRRLDYGGVVWKAAGMATLEYGSEIWACPSVDR